MARKPTEVTLENLPHLLRARQLATDLFRDVNRIICSKHRRAGMFGEALDEAQANSLAWFWSDLRSRALRGKLVEDEAAAREQVLALAYWSARRSAMFPPRAAEQSDLFAACEREELELAD